MKGDSGFNQQMLQALTPALEPGESLYAPVYGTLLQNRKSYMCFFGLTKKFLLVAFLSNNGDRIIQTSRVPLDIRSVEVKNNKLIGQKKLHVTFNNGTACTFRLAKAVFQLNCQPLNLQEFEKRLRDAAE